MAITDIYTDDESYDVSHYTGFLPPEVPLERLPADWEPWEAILDDAVNAKLSVGSKWDITKEEVERSEAWRERLLQMPTLPTDSLKSSDPLLRRAHLVLAFLLHIYIHTSPPTSPILIPPPLGIPLILVSNTLSIPCDVTYSDTVLYNWRPKDASKPLTVENLQSQTLFTGMLDEEEFYLASTRIELRGVEALEIVSVSMRDLLILQQQQGANNNEALEETRRRTTVEITARLMRLTEIINEMKDLLMNVRKGCRPTEYYRDVRPWLSGQDSDRLKRKWTFTGLSQPGVGLPHPTELSGPSAGQSSTIHVLDAFLAIPNTHSSPPRTANAPSFQDRMRLYMPRKHRAYVERILGAKASLREFVIGQAQEGGEGRELGEAYNMVVKTMKEFRDAHMIIATMYIVSPARKAEKERLARVAAAAADSGEVPSPMKKGDEEKEKEKEERKVLKGTGGTDLVRFLKDVRENTMGATISLGV